MKKAAPILYVLFVLLALVATLLLLYRDYNLNLDQEHQRIQQEIQQRKTLLEDFFRSQEYDNEEIYNETLNSYSSGDPSLEAVLITRPGQAVVYQAIETRSKSLMELLENFNAAAGDEGRLYGFKNITHEVFSMPIQTGSDENLQSFFIYRIYTAERILKHLRVALLVVAGLFLLTLIIILLLSKTENNDDQDEDPLFAAIENSESMETPPPTDMGLSDFSNEMEQTESADDDFKLPDLDDELSLDSDIATDELGEDSFEFEMPDEEDSFQATSDAVELETEQASGDNFSDYLDFDMPSDDSGLDDLDFELPDQELDDTSDPFEQADESSDISIETSGDSSFDDALDLELPSSDDDLNDLNEEDFALPDVNDDLELTDIESEDLDETPTMDQSEEQINEMDDLDFEMPEEDDLSDMDFELPDDEANSDALDLDVDSLDVEESADEPMLEELDEQDLDLSESLETKDSEDETVLENTENIDESTDEFDNLDFDLPEEDTDSLEDLDLGIPEDDSESLSNLDIGMEEDESNVLTEQDQEDLSFDDTESFEEIDFELPEVDKIDTEALIDENESSEGTEIVETEENTGLYDDESGLAKEEFFADRLEQEISRSASKNENMSLALISAQELSDEAFSTLLDTIRENYQDRDLNFQRGERGLALLLQDSELNPALQRIRELTEPWQDNIRVGVSARNSRLIDAAQLLTEAEHALGRAQAGKPVIGFKADPDLYRENLN